MSRAVIDQPGVRVVLIGLLVSLMLGLALRSQIADERIQVYINRSIDRLQPDFFVDYESAKVHLSNWGLPLPVLLVSNIRMSPKNNLCQNSQIYVDELEIPISLSAILGISKYIPKIRAKEIELRLSDIDRCMGEPKPAPQNEVHLKLSGDKKTEPEAEASVKNIFTHKTKAELKEVYIEKLKIIFNKKPDQPLLLRQLNLELSYAGDRLSEVAVKSKISALKDTRSDVYFLSSSLVALFKKKAGGEVESIISLSGKLLDGDVQLFAHAFSGTQKVSYELAVEQVSFKALLPLIDTAEPASGFNLISSLEKTAVSLSFVNKGEMTLGPRFSVESKLKKAQVNVESGVLKIAEVQLNYSDNRVVLNPFVLKVESLALSKLKNIEQFRKKLESFESLGELSGILDFKNDYTYEVTGRLKNVQVVFSNRGRRDLQNVDQVELTVQRNGPRLGLQATGFVVNNEKVDGKLSVTHDIGSLVTEAQLRIAGTVFGAKIWEQFTFVEQTPKVELLWAYRKAGLETSNLKLHVEGLALPGIKIDQLNVDLLQTLSADGTSSTLAATIKPTRFVTDEKFLENKVVSAVLNPGKDFKGTSLSSGKTLLTLTGSDWKNVNFSLDSIFTADAAPKAEARLSFKGLVKYKGGLNGRLTLQSKTVNSKFDLFSNGDDDIVIKPLQ